MLLVVYPSDLTDQQWECIKDLLPRATRGRPRTVSLRSVVNAILYLHHGGCPWRYLPKTYPKWKTVYGYFSRWSKQDFWKTLCRTLHECVRAWSGRSAKPHLVIIDSQSVRAPKGDERGYDGFKKVRGRKRNILVDALGILVSCKVTAANAADTKSGKELLDTLPQAILENVETILADKSYRGAMVDYAEYYYQKKVVIAQGGKNGSNLKPMRWRVERTFAWLNHYRRMSRDYENRVRNSESMLYISMLPILLHRLTAGI